MLWHKVVVLQRTATYCQTTAGAFSPFQSLKPTGDPHRERYVSTLGAIWRIGSPYFFRKTAGRDACCSAPSSPSSFGIVAITVLLNQWNARFYNALQDRNWDAFVYELGYFCVLATIFIIVAVYQLYLNQWLQIRWRRWMTRAYLDHWLEGSNHYRMQLLGDAADNPDQRIAEDIKQFIDGGSSGVGVLPIGLGLLNSVVTLISFSFDPVESLRRRAAACVRRGVGYPGLSVLGRPDLRDRRHGADASDRPAAYRPELPAAALRSRLPLQSRARAGERRTDRVAGGRSAPNATSCSTASAVWSATGWRS